MRYLLLVLLLALGISLAQADENQAFLGIFAETTSMKMVGMPDFVMPALPPGMPMPAGLAMLMPQRLLTVRLWSPSIAAPDAQAALAIPDGLKLGKVLNLSLFRPEPEKVTTPGTPPDTSIPDFTILRYWGSSATVKDGQPEKFSLKDLTPEQQEKMKEASRSAQKANSYYYKPGWTTGYWPGDKQNSAMQADATLQGKYSLTSNYTGNVEIQVPDTVNFLAPIKLSSPKFDAALPLDKPIVFTWDAIPTNLGSCAQIIGMKGKDTIIIWSSSEVRTDPGMAWDYLDMTTVTAHVQARRFMSPDQLTVTVPSGIFQGCDSVFLRMIAYGPGTALDAGQPLPRVQTKTTLTAMLGGKMMTEHGGRR